MIQFVKYRYINFIFSGALGVLSILAIWIWGFNYGIEFKGGAAVEVFSNNPLSADVVNEVAKTKEIQITSVQNQGGGVVSIRSDNLDENKKTELVKALDEKVGGVKENSFQTIGPSFGQDASRRAIWSVAIAVLAIVIYISYAFRGVKYPFTSWQMGLSAIIALVHDTLLTSGFVVVSGHWFGYQLDSLIIVALLTLLGFSVHDTIVVFDRIRENLRTMGTDNLNEVIDYSINQTLARSIATSMTLMLVILSLVALGGPTIRHFTLTLAVGVFFGTYSSIFVASPLLLYWHTKKHR